MRILSLSTIFSFAVTRFCVRAIRQSWLMNSAYAFAVSSVIVPCSHAKVMRSPPACRSLP